MFLLAKSTRKFFVQRRIFEKTLCLTTETPFWREKKSFCTSKVFHLSKIKELETKDAEWKEEEREEEINETGSEEDFLKNVPLETADDFFRRATIYKQQGKLKEALWSVEEAIKRDSSDTRFFILRGHCYEESNQLKKALEEYTRVTTLQPQNFPAFVAVAQCLKKMGEERRAVQVCSNVLSLDNKFHAALNCRADTYFQLGEMEKAEEDYRKLAEVQNQARGFLGLGNICLGKSEFEDAKQNFLEAIQMEREMYEAWSGLGIVYYLEGDGERAANAFTCAIEKSGKEFADLFCKRAAAFVLMEKWKSAFKDAEKAIQLDSRQPQAFLIRAQCMQSAKKWDEAIFDYTEFLRQMREVEANDEEEKKQKAQVLVARAECYLQIILENKKNQTFLTEEEKAKNKHKQQEILDKVNAQIASMLVEDLKQVMQLMPSERPKCDKLFEETKKALKKEENKQNKQNKQKEESKVQVNSKQKEESKSKEERKGRKPRRVNKALKK